MLKIILTILLTLSLITIYGIYLFFFKTEIKPIKNIEIKPKPIAFVYGNQNDSCYLKIIKTGKKILYYNKKMETIELNKNSILYYP